MLFKNLNPAPPFQLFESYYVKAEENGQPHVEAGCVSSVDVNGQPHARYVNFKYFFEDHLIFFSNYKSDKAKQFENNALVAVNFWWPNTDTQIRIEGEISKCSEKFSDQHFQEREIGKNISAIASNQSEEIESYEILREKYDAIKAKVDAGEIQENRPSDWGGFQIKINYFEFWEAFEDRLNYRECYKKESDSCRKFFLQS